MNLKHIIPFFIGVLLSFSLTAKDIYVSPDGNDSKDGTKKFPLKTISAAQKLAIGILESGNETEVTVWLAGGIYPIAGPLEFNLLNSNRENVSLMFKAQKGESPVISGGMEITGWSKNSDGFWEAPLPASLKGMDNFRELFISGKRAIRARFPNEGYLHVKKAGEDRRTNFFFEKEDFPIPKKPEGLELVFLHDWSISRIGIKEIDAAKNQLFTVDSIGAKSPAFFTIDNWEPNPRYFLENAPEFLDADYEWIFHNDSKKFILKLPEGINPNNLQVVVPLSEGLISIIGEENQPVKNIHFEGITFQFSKWEIPEKGYCGVQACHFDPRPSTGGWSVVPAAITSVWAENISFKGCSFKNFGGSGIWFGTGSKNCKVEDSELMDISGNGIMIGEGQDRIVNGDPWWKSAPDQVALANSIENSKISQIGAQFYGAVGIWCGLTAETKIKNNEVFDLPYTGISVGWMWSPEPTPARQNIISGNHIHDIMKILSDGGGIYMLGLQPGSKILNNRIHNVEVNAGRAESNGMFLDEGITDVLVERNLVYNIAKSPLRFHRATVNLVRENYFFCKDGNPPIRYNTTQEEDIRKVDNKFFSAGEPTYQRELKKAIIRWEKKNR
ncbi:MAG: right-handed parallel beta-helix repeat-containing protein [Algoriphagus sp.]|nr:right-handed parallel beta-helix repeat-containing protein [Algoriphagus sp.]